MSTSTVLVIGKGRFGSAAAQGLREGFVESEDGFQTKCDVVQVSATKFMGLSIPEMANELQDKAFVFYCGTKLSEYSRQLASAIQLATTTSRNAVEFVDFSNPDPTLEQGDVSGAIDLWVALNSQGKDEEVTKGGLPLVKVWKITEVGSVDVSGIMGNTDGLVYGSHPGQLPRFTIPNLLLKPAGENASLFDEARNRIQDRAGIDCWHDGNILGMAMFAFTGMYAILRYNVNVNGSEPHSNIVMYLLDKAFAWTGLWMMVVSPFAGNLLAIGSIYQQWSQVGFLQKLVTLFCSVLMILPTILFSLTWIFWIIARNIYFAFRWPVSSMYLGQSPDPDYQPRMSWIKASLVDMVNMKGETGCVGFVYAFIHSFLGCIICDVAYKGYWFDPETGRLIWRMELSMMTGCVSTALLWVVTMRSLMGKASWIRLKPLYSYVSPIGIWFAVVHVMAFGAKGWNTLFNKNYHNGQMSITFVSSMYPACVLLVHHIFSLCGTKKACQGDYYWKHSVVRIATDHYEKIMGNGPANDLDATVEAHDLSMRTGSKKSSMSNNQGNQGFKNDSFDNFVDYLEQEPKKIEH